MWLLPCTRWLHTSSFTTPKPTDDTAAVQLVCKEVAVSWKYRLDVFQLISHNNVIVINTAAVLQRTYMCYFTADGHKVFATVSVHMQHQGKRHVDKKFINDVKGVFSRSSAGCGYLSVLLCSPGMSQERYGTCPVALLVTVSECVRT